MRRRLLKMKNEQAEYEVFNPDGQRVMYAPERCRYPSSTELSLLEAGYTIRLHGKRITKTEVRKNHDTRSTPVNRRI